MSASFAPVPVEVESTVETSPRQTATPSQQAPLRLRRYYRGGFSTSICDLFSDTYDRSSFCALACCGILLQDRTNYVLTQELPPPLWRRALVNGGGLILFAVIGTMVWENGLLGIITAFVLWGIYGTNLRSQVRKRIMDMLHPPVPLRDEDGCCADHRRAHRCCACIPSDILYHAQTDGEEPDDDDITVNRDACNHLWTLLSNIFFGCFGCWWNCCGMCASAQEDREMRKLFPREKFRMDYITMQPYSEYYPDIQTLRRSQDGSLWAHLKTMSKLSTTLVRIVAIGLLILLALSVLHIFKHFRIENVLVVVLTLFQAFAVVYLVYWRNHRFDVSLDAVVKFFASGFILAATVALMIELVTAISGNIFFMIVFGAEYAEDNPTQTVQPTSKQVIRDIAEHHLPTLLTFLFFQSFVVASMCEELTKYFCFWIVEHPDYDFLPSGHITSSAEEDEVGGAEAFETNGSEEPKEESELEAPNIHSQSSAITIGLVATAAGFACMENLMYSLEAGSSFSSGK